jgi:hypothetical protein
MADDDLTDRILREIQTGLVDLRQQNGVIIRMLQRIEDRLDRSEDQQLGLMRSDLDLEKRVRALERAKEDG